MINPLSAAGAYAAIQRVGQPMQGGGGAAGGVQAPGAGDFQSVLSQSVGGVVNATKKADVAALAAAKGQGNLVDVVTAVAESEAAIETLVAVRDRVIQAYDEIMRMPI